MKPNELAAFLDYFAEIVADKLAAKLKEEKGAKKYKDDDMLLTPAAAEYLGKSPATLRNWRQMNKKLPFYINKETLEATYRFSDLKAFKDRMNRISPSG
jgi:hypothetical protein